MKPREATLFTPLLTPRRLIERVALARGTAAARLEAGRANVQVTGQTVAAEMEVLAKVRRTVGLPTALDTLGYKCGT